MLLFHVCVLWTSACYEVWSCVWMWSGEECAGDLPKALGSAWRVCVCVRVLYDILGGMKGFPLWGWMWEFSSSQLWNDGKQRRMWMEDLPPPPTSKIIKNVIFNAASLKILPFHSTGVANLKVRCSVFPSLRFGQVMVLMQSNWNWSAKPQKICVRPWSVNTLFLFHFFNLPHTMWLHFKRQLFLSTLDSG